MPEDMRRTCHLLLATAILAAPMPVAAQVTVDPNALNALGGPAILPEPPPAVPGQTHRSYHSRRRHLARAEREHGHAHATAVASNSAPTPGAGTPSAAAAGGVVLEHPKNLGPSFTSLPPLPQAPPPLPPPPPVLATATPKPGPAPAKPVETAQAAPAPKPKPALPPAPAAAATAAAPSPSPAPIPPQLALPAAVPPPPSSPASAPASAPARLAEATPGPPAAAPPAPAPPAAAPDALPKGADLLTLPFLLQESDLPPAETAMLRNFTERYAAGTQYIVRSFASAPPGDDDPSTPRRIALARAQSVASALLDSGAQPDKVRLLALGDAGGSPANRVEVIAMPPSSGHTASPSSP
jgi:hypothetical protein